MSLYEMNCSDKTYTIKDITQYTDKGEVLDNLKFDDKLVIIPPGSLTENLFNKVCVPGKNPKK
jgi:mannose-6-phosphate isomerase class I